MKIQKADDVQNLSVKLYKYFVTKLSYLNIISLFIYEKNRPLKEIWTILSIVSLL